METSPPPPRLLASGQRSVFLVKKRLQIKIMALVLGAVTAAVVLIGLDIYWTVGGDVVGELMDPGLHAPFRHMMAVTAVKISFYLLGVAFLALLLSNKMAGPVYRFERSTRIVADGDLTHRVRLRKGDELTELQDGFNAMLDALHKRASQDAALAARLVRQLDELAKEDLPPAALQRLKELRTEVEHIASGFKI